MSRHNVTYKPGGAIARPLELTIKMQRVPEEAVAPAPMPACPVCPPGDRRIVEDNFNGQYLPNNGYGTLAFNEPSGENLIGRDWIDTPRNLGAPQSTRADWRYTGRGAVQQFIHDPTLNPAAIFASGAPNKYPYAIELDYSVSSLDRITTIYIVAEAEIAEVVYGPEGDNGDLGENGFEIGFFPGTSGVYMSYKGSDGVVNSAYFNTYSPMSGTIWITVDVDGFSFSLDGSSWSNLFARTPPAWGFGRMGFSSAPNVLLDAKVSPMIHGFRAYYFDW